MTWQAATANRTAEGGEGGKLVTTYAYIDNSNLCIEGCRISGVQKGRAKNIFEAMKTGVVDPTWKEDGLRPPLRIPLWQGCRGAPVGLAAAG